LDAAPVFVPGQPDNPLDPDQGAILAADLQPDLQPDELYNDAPADNDHIYDIYDPENNQQQDNTVVPEANAAAQGAHEENVGNDDDEILMPEANDAAQGAHEEAAAHEHHYNLRHRAPNQGGRHFKEAMDNPYNSKSYFPPAEQLVQVTGNATKTNIDTNKRIFAHIMTQMTAKAGLKKYGKEAEIALMKEFTQLEDLNVYESIDATSLTNEQKKGALRAINLIKEKRDGRIKGRTVADGRPQRTLYDKSQTASPTVSTDALMLSILVDAHEGRDVATADVAGAYLKADMDDFVVMKFVGESVDILCEMNTKHKRFVVTEKGAKTLYVRLVKALYGCVKSALLWYDLFHGTLKEMGFVLNPYDSCIANCTIDGKQCTIAWYVDDNKISHADPQVVNKVIENIEERFGKMTITRGKEHVFLGMNIRYTGSGTAVITMKDYLKEAIQESGMKITRIASSPANKTLFDVDDGADLLEKGEAEMFHSVVAKLLYVSIRARMDLLLAVGFLCTRVSKSTTQDRTKLRRVLEYIHGTMDLEYTIGADSMGKLRSWVDASYAVHPDMKSHTGGVMSFGTGGLICKSSKQKLNTKSSTEAELVGVSDYLPNTMWVKMFLEAQGYKMNGNFLEQDNESAIKLAKNGRISAGPKSRHINIRYFWIKDRAKAEGINIRHCPTLQMLADFFTKPLQGSLFQRFRNVILGYAHVDSLATVPRLSIEERVGNKRFDNHGTGVKLVTSTTKHDGTVSPEPRKTRHVTNTVTWADVVRNTPARTRDADNKRVVSRSFSRNNPVSIRNKV
jgi:hypothetical protein